MCGMLYPQNDIISLSCLVCGVNLSNFTFLPFCPFSDIPVKLSNRAVAISRFNQISILEVTIQFKLGFPFKNIVNSK